MAAVAAGTAAAAIGAVARLARRSRLAWRLGRLLRLGLPPLWLGRMGRMVGPWHQHLCRWLRPPLLVSGLRLLPLPLSLRLGLLQSETPIL